ncbi:MAG: peptide chain release factor N(5)-glutamine methyltransferase [Ruminococcaceae bacterium]|nr:peptide chain release factor N(5)-glutamine methyltransferase [Oscillospiraceae bacterium]
MVSLLLKKQVRTILEQHGSDSAAFETEQILKWATGFDRLTLTPDSEIDDEKAKTAIDAAKRRVKGEPLQYILGEWDFFGLTFHVGEGVLIPRPETELLVEKTLEELKNGGTVIDLCSGSGCIPIAVSKKSGASCYGIEISEKALEYFKENIILNNVEDSVTPLCGDVLNPSDTLLERLPEKCDIITANPPYLTADDMRELQKEVRHEPEIALFGGTDGLDFYRVIFGKWKKRLAENGEFIVETGDHQAEAIREIMEKEGFSCEIINDYNKIGRFVFGKLAS